jgi:tryptophan synthase beta chain
MGINEYAKAAASRITEFDGHFGEFGGQYVAETLMPAITEADVAFQEAWADPEFHKEYRQLLKDYVGRPSAMFHAESFSKKLGGAQIWLKREDLNHTGAHKINNTIGQVLLAMRMGKKRIIAETGAGQHGVATATACAMFGLPCEVFMGEEDIRRQVENVKRMRIMGAKVVSVTSGTGTLKDAMNEALRDWVATVDDTFYVIGSVAGPHPYPIMVREFQRIIGEEAREQIIAATGRLPDSVVACVGGGSNAMGMFAAFVDDKDVELVGVEAAGHGVTTNEHAASILGGEVGVLHGSKTYLLQTDEGQICNAHSISAGLDYPGIGPEHSFLHASGRVRFVNATDDEAVKGFLLLTRTQGIIPALESSHALVHPMREAKALGPDHVMVINLSGRGDKDLGSISEYLEAHPELDA